MLCYQAIRRLHRYSNKSKSISCSLLSLRVNYQFNLQFTINHRTNERVQYQIPNTNQLKYSRPCYCCVENNIEWKANSLSRNELFVLIPIIRNDDDKLKLLQWLKKEIDQLNWLISIGTWSKMLYGKWSMLNWRAQLRCSRPSHKLRIFRICSLLD